MKNRTPTVTLRRAALLCAALLALSPGCGDEGNPVDPGELLCAGQSGFGARVGGRAETVDVCVSDGDATAVITSGSHYSVTARKVTSDVTFEFFFVFPVLGPDAPAVLSLHDDLGAAQADPLGVYVYYQEIPAQGGTIESFELTGGSFTLSFSATDVLTATMSGITMKMRTVANPQESGTRVIEQGFMSLSVDS